MQAAVYEAIHKQCRCPSSASISRLEAVKLDNSVVLLVAQLHGAQKRLADLQLEAEVRVGRTTTAPPTTTASGARAVFAFIIVLLAINCTN
jgi:hypothetical protein